MLLLLLTYGAWDRRSQPSAYMQFICAPDLVHSHDGDADLARRWDEGDDRDHQT
jgi:hypothetical protein